MKILIIDDDTNITEIWGIALKQNNFEVLTATSGRSGIDQAKTQKPDFILIDQIMPDMKGNDILKILKEDPVTNMIPVAIASNYSDTQLMQEAIQQGALDYILKYQIEPLDLISKIKNLLQKTQNTNS
ncbi:response regulator [Patescibacteria group bacterium]|nr:response regulator [Patescibacteria group bacterium]MBU4017307.1 response regulator [Patescibacteria group bacterium]